MSSTTSITLPPPKHKTKTSPDNPKSKKKNKKSVKHTTNISEPPFENEFLQFYSELYKSAILFSDRNYQQMLLFPQYQQKHHLKKGRGGHSPSSPQLGNLLLNIPQPLQKNSKNLTSPTKQQTTSSTTRNVKKASRRLSSGSGHGGQISKPSTTSSDYNSAESSGRGSLNKKAFSQHFLLAAAAASSFTGFPSTSTPTTTTATTTTMPAPGKIPKLKRRVSFSKNSPRTRSRSNSNNGGGCGGDMNVNVKGHNNDEHGGDHVPSIQENEWSSDMDETDTTETEDEDNGNATLGEGDDYIFAKSETGTWDGDNEHSTTDDGNHAEAGKQKGTIKKAESSEELLEREVEAKFSELSTTQGNGMPESEA